VTGYVALLRAVNVAGRKLLMKDLKAIADELGLEGASTYIASGNLLFASDKSEAALKGALEDKLAARLGAPVGVLVRTAAEMAAVARANPFDDRPGNRVVAIFLDKPPPKDAVDTAARLANDEAIATGTREIYVGYGKLGMGRSKMQVPAAAAGTARNMNTVAKLAELAKEKA